MQATVAKRIALAAIAAMSLAATLGASSPSVHATGLGNGGNGGAGGSTVSNGGNGGSTVGSGGNGQGNAIRTRVGGPGAINGAGGPQLIGTTQAPAPGGPR